ncbi:Hypothetical protein A7982_00073 [Minicystis rosea]|nr:Hypothetical protein A7982_00073 [Minicystis rosea]
MSFLAETSIDLSVSPEIAFDALADHAGWAAWMPRTFVPVGPTHGTLRAGDRILVRIAHGPMPTPIVVSVVDRAREITWRGGPRGVLAAEHRFLFEPNGAGGTRVRSVERWDGALAPLVRPILKRLAERIGAQQLAGLARAVRGRSG